MCHIRQEKEHDDDELCGSRNFLVGWRVSTHRGGGSTPLFCVRLPLLVHGLWTSDASASFSERAHPRVASHHLLCLLIVSSVPCAHASGWCLLWLCMVVCAPLSVSVCLCRSHDYSRRAAGTRVEERLARHRCMWRMPSAQDLHAANISPSACSPLGGARG